jgi:hypothetical protein
MIFLQYEPKNKIMFKHPAILLAYFKYAILPSIIASVPVIFFIRESTFSQTWLLYLGDAFFLFSMVVVMLILSRQAHDDAGTGALLIAGHAITVFSIILICVITFILLLIYVPGLFSPGNTQKSLTQTPANMVYDKTHGLMFVLYMNAVFGTGTAGSFASIVMSYSTRREQRGDKAEI